MAVKSAVTDWLTGNPKLLGALCTLMFLLAEVGNVVASGDAKAGP
ncbi:DUF7503 family protein [Halorussus salinisoli]